MPCRKRDVVQIRFRQEQRRRRIICIDHLRGIAFQCHLNRAFPIPCHQRVKELRELLHRRCRASSDTFLAFQPSRGVHQRHMRSTENQPRLRMELPKRAGDLGRFRHLRHRGGEAIGVALHLHQIFQDSRAHVADAGQIQYTHVHARLLEHGGHFQDTETREDELV